MTTRKFSTILLVVLVASQCTAQPSISDIVKKVMDYVRDEIQKVESWATAVEHEAQQEAEKLVTRVREEIQKVEKQLQDEMKTITETSANVVSCITAERGNISKVYTDAEKQAQMCVLKAGVKVLPLLTKANATIQKVKQNINDVIADLRKPECTGSLDAPIRCIMNEVPKIRQDVEDLVKQVQDLVEKARQAIPQAVQAGEQCVQKIVQDSAAQLRAIFNEIRNCVMGQ